MNTKFFASALIAAASFAAAPSFASDIASGEVGDVPVAAAAATSGLSRAQVQDDYRLAERNGTLAQVGEVGSPVVVTAAGRALSRDTVRADAVLALQHGQQRPGLV